MNTNARAKERSRVYVTLKNQVQMLARDDESETDGFPTISVCNFCGVECLRLNIQWGPTGFSDYWRVTTQDNRD